MQQEKQGSQDEQNADYSESDMNQPESGSINQDQGYKGGQAGSEETDLSE